MNTKKFIKFSILVVFVGIIGYTLYNTNKVTPLSDLAKANIEALANGETGKVNCCPDPGDECKLSTGDILHDQDEC